MQFSQTRSSTIDELELAPSSNQGYLLLCVIPHRKAQGKKLYYAHYENSQ